MNFAKDVTLVVGVDEKYFDQFNTVFKLWLKFWPQLRCVDWVFFYDGRHEETRERLQEITSSFRRYNVATVQAWRPPELEQYEDQRDRMLAGWVYVPTIVTTKYFLKIDTDAFPVRPMPGSFPNARWFEADPAIVGHSWGYTKQRGTKSDWFEILDRFGDDAHSTRRHRPLDLRFPTGSRRLSHKRIASYVAFVDAQFNAEVAADCLKWSDQKWTIPVPSQDTLLWYCAERAKKPIIRVKFKKHGWTNQSNTGKLKASVHELLTT